METVVKTEPFSFNGKDYEIKVFKNNHGYTAQAFLDGNPAKVSPISVNFYDTTPQNWNWHYGKEPPSELIKMIEVSIRNNCGEIDE